jgi:hypothetical protein
VITGISLIRNGNLLGYPWKICIQQLLGFCSEVIVNCDPGDDNTLEELKAYPVRILESKWDMSNTGDGRILAIEANKLLPLITNRWTIYLQADEIIHQKDYQMIKPYIYTMDKIGVNQIELYRTYFWQDINHRLENDEIYLGRIFRTGTHIIGGDGMYIQGSGQVVRSPFWIYHYSRIGTPEFVNKRLRNLDRLFHSSEEVEAMGLYNYNKQAEGKTILPYNDTHPAGIQEFYDKLR